jgi:small nuclear ribonucleoprotein (snRNP)-like protein
VFRKSIVKRAVLNRFAVTLTGVEDTFEGVLTQFDTEMFVFEDCKTVATREGETTVKIPGRLFVEREKVSYLQERS